jgi:hypothetical protein
MGQLEQLDTLPRDRMEEKEMISYWWAIGAGVAGLLTGVTVGALAIERLVYRALCRSLGW